MLESQRVVVGALVTVGYVSFVAAFVLGLLPLCYRNAVVTGHGSHSVMRQQGGYSPRGPGSSVRMYGELEYTLELAKPDGTHIAFVTSRDFPEAPESVRYLPLYPEFFIRDAEFSFGPFWVGSILLGLVGAAFYCVGRTLFSDDKPA